MGLLLTITGPSCSGKSTLEEALVQRGFARVISNTSRAPRVGEVDGVHYKFRDRAWFAEQEANHALIESVDFNGNLYGNTAQDITDALDKGVGAAVWVIEPVGLQQVKRWHSGLERNIADPFDLRCVFVTNPLPVLLKRFIKRNERGGLIAINDKELSRIDMMVGIEREWVNVANSLAGRQLYDHVFNSLDDSNAGSVLEFFCQLGNRQAIAA